MKNFLTFVLVFICSVGSLFSQKNKKDHLVYVDKHGVLRYTKTNAEAAFFGVNYTTPFAYGYRSHKALGINLEKAIDQDVYHLSRLGFDAFRVHVWDTEITDSLGNLLDNDHLRLYDYLLFKLKKYGIKTFFTPIAFWGNGYPERDQKTTGFSSIYNKQRALVTEAAIKAQENYIRQILRHVNPYTKMPYGDDPDVIAIEINNEPHHSGPKEKTTQYVNRMAAAARSTGWNKPVFYNISESPNYADAVAMSNIDGVSFQWYPTGLVANRTLKGNYLPHVDHYRIPFGDTIAAYRNKARMVYEFDAGDVLQSCMYPAMARSFRTAGFQWATQFAYDPMATAYGNTEYQTHFVNLAYTPSKAISLLIASKVFHKVPRLKSYGKYPQDTLFDVFRVSYANDLSEMNSDEEFYYSNSTTTRPRNPDKLTKIAGIGNSPVVRYFGTGAYFLDYMSEGVWRLEVMPDAVQIRDPFERASPKKEVTRIQWDKHSMEIILPGIGQDFTISGLNEGNDYSVIANGYRFDINPGAYFITSKAGSEKGHAMAPTVREYVAPPASDADPFLYHIPYTEVSANKPFILDVTAVGLDSGDIASVEFRNTSNRWRTIPLKKSAAYSYSAEVPSDLVLPGILNYRIIIRKKDSGYYLFPGNHTGDPYAWDNYINDTWQTFVAAENSPIQLFNPTTDRNTVVPYNSDWRNNTVEYPSSSEPLQLIYRAKMNAPKAGQMMGFQYYFDDKLKGRKEELSSAKKLVISARTSRPEGSMMKVSLISKTAVAYAAYFRIHDTFQDIEIPLENLKIDSMLLLPRPYPGFLPLWFGANDRELFDIHNAEKLEVSFGFDLKEQDAGKAFNVEIGSVVLKK